MSEDKKQRNGIMTIEDIRALQIANAQGKWPWKEWLQDLQPGEGREITKEVKEAGLKPHSFTANTATAKQHGLRIMRSKNRVLIVKPKPSGE